MPRFLACYQGLGIHLSEPRIYGSEVELLMDMKDNTYQPDLVIDEDTGQVIYTNAKLHFPTPIPTRERWWSIIIMNTFGRAYWAESREEATAIATRANVNAIENFYNVRYVPIPCNLTALYEACQKCRHGIDLSLDDWMSGWSAITNEFTFVHTRCHRKAHHG